MSLIQCIEVSVMQHEVKSIILHFLKTAIDSLISIDSTQLTTEMLKPYGKVIIETNLAEVI